MVMHGLSAQDSDLCAGEIDVLIRDGSALLSEGRGLLSLYIVLSKSTFLLFRLLFRLVTRDLPGLSFHLLRTSSRCLGSLPLPRSRFTLPFHLHSPLPRHPTPLEILASGPDARSVLSAL
jgi:hypothetical protein